MQLPRSKNAGLAGAIPIIFVLAGALSTLGLAGSPHPSPSPTAAAGPTPVLAYYYMWFGTASWTHAKTDLPALGAYTSTDPAIIRQQVTWARESGVDAFIASWKSTPSLNTALSELVAECHRQGLKLVLIYEGLDVNRNPIPASTVKADLLAFEDQYGSDPVFQLFGKPVVIWSGSWAFSDADISAIRSSLGAPDKLLLLGSEKSGAAYTARAGLFDGDAYYWSSGDPLATPGYQTRLTQLSASVHAAHGLWLAPASAGYDGRLNGGTTVVDRRDGATLRSAWSDALATKPDGVALISWNEYTENSYVEPSRDFGMRYLQVLSGITGAPGPPTGIAPAAGTLPPTTAPLLTAQSPGATSRPNAYDATALLVAGLILGLLALLGFSLRRNDARSGSRADGTQSELGRQSDSPGGRFR